ncbi:MAG TPA: hypothetical protein VI895_05755 [Bdellovibrionota bacterium]|nr:hypothetical protein [Bdellovibrionota bacterium]
MNRTILTLFLVILGFGFAVQAQEKEPMKREPVKIGDEVTAGWGPTSTEAAATPEQKKVLEKGKVVSITGEVVDVSCYMQLGKRGEKHIDCGKKCVLNGQPFGVVDKKGELTLIIPEEHHPRRDGQVSLKEKFADLMGQEVTVTGILSKYKRDRALFVKAAPYTPAKPQ